MWAPFSAYAAGVYAYNDHVEYMWAAPAGITRGKFDAIDLAINPNLKQRDRFYEISLNPVVYYQGDGYVVMGQKTLQTKPTAFDRINVRRLFLSLERSTARTLRQFVFEPNTTFTRSRVVTSLIPLFDLAKGTSGLYDYLIVADERNNPINVIENNEMVVDIYIKPVRTAEFILVNFVATRTGQDFQELL
jgi:phage tail sheath protein FI